MVGIGIIARIKGEEPGILKKIPHAFRGKGHYGEHLTEYALVHGNLGNVAVFSNVIVPRASGPTSTSGIDVVMLHEKGIFAVESKNYSGWIFGSADQRNWTVTLNANSKEHFYNPIKQNRSHVKALSTHLGLEEEAFRSYIVFSERCELKKVPPDTAEYVICRRHHLLGNMRKDLAHFDSIFDTASFEEPCASLAALAKGSTQAARATCGRGPKGRVGKRLHVVRLRARQAQRQIRAVHGSRFLPKMPFHLRYLSAG